MVGEGDVGEAAEAGADTEPADGRTNRGASTPRRRTMLDHRQRVAEEELRNDVLRFRRLTTWAAPMWPGFGLLDWIVVTFIEPGRLVYYFLIRLVGAVPIGLGLWGAWRLPNMTRARFMALDLMTFCATTIGVSLMCLEYRGIASPYFAGIIVIIVIRGSILADPWRRGALLLGIPVLMYPLVLLTAGYCSPRVAAQFQSSHDLATFVQGLFFITVAGVLGVYGGHATWALRRQAFEARNIGRYRLKRSIGKGGMGEVWVAYHTGLKRDVALKTLCPGIDQDPEHVSRFEHEVAAMSRLTHPNTVRVFDYGVTEDGIWYYAMELLEGCNLAELVGREGPLPGARAVRIAHQLARALAEAHAKGIVHRDVKPQNVFIARAGGEADHVKVLDFGIAKLTRDAHGTSLTATGSILGTPAYMSPEAATGKQVDARSDVYAVGAVLHFMLTGRPPFDDESVESLLAQQVAAPPPSLLDEDPSAPAELDQLLRRCLSKRPAERFANGKELADALGTCLATVALSEAPPVGSRPALGRASSAPTTIAAEARAGKPRTQE